jgi:NTP pyrophosphatase (non-canonical NTP hydrolase)
MKGVGTVKGTCTGEKLLDVEGRVNQFTIREWVKAAGENARSKGFHEVATMATNIANIHSELSELWEAYRKDLLDNPCDKPIALTCLEEELADIAIRTFDMAFQNGVDLQRAIELKHVYNTTRPRMHGGKKA